MTEKKENSEMEIETLAGQPCPMCQNKTLTLTEGRQDIPYFGITYLFSMHCSSCSYHKADIEAEERKDPIKCTFEVSAEKDMNIRVVKSSEATVKIPHMITISPGPASDGFITNIEGLLNRVKSAIQSSYDMSEEDEDRKKAKNLLKKLQKVMWGQEKLKIIIEDPSGNSAIISDRTEVTKIKG